MTCLHVGVLTGLSVLGERSRRKVVAASAPAQRIREDHGAFRGQTGTRGEGSPEASRQSGSAAVASAPAGAACGDGA